MKFFSNLRVSFVASIALLSCTAPALAQQSSLISQVDLYRSDNAFSGAKLAAPNVSGLDAQAPELDLSKAETVLGLSFIWLNLLSTDLGEHPVTISPFLRHRAFAATGYKSTAFGVAVGMELLDSVAQKLDVRASFSRLESSWLSDSTEEISLNASYEVNSIAGGKLELDATLARQFLLTDRVVNRIEVGAEYHNSFGATEMSMAASLGLRDSETQGFSGTDASLAFGVKRQAGLGRVHVNLDSSWVDDRRARVGLSEARSHVKTAAEIGYQFPLGYNRNSWMVVYARRERIFSNLATDDSTTNVFGASLRYAF